jgi:hypothetical protein
MGRRPLRPTGRATTRPGPAARRSRSRRGRHARVLGHASHATATALPPGDGEGLLSAMRQLARHTFAVAGASIQASSTAKVSPPSDGHHVAGAQARAQPHRHLALEHVGRLGAQRASVAARPSMRSTISAIGAGSRSRSATRCVMCSSSCMWLGSRWPGRWRRPCGPPLDALALDGQPQHTRQRDAPRHDVGQVGRCGAHAELDQHVLLPGCARRSCKLQAAAGVVQW